MDMYKLISHRRWLGLLAQLVAYFLKRAVNCLQSSGTGIVYDRRKEMGI